MSAGSRAVERDLLEMVLAGESLDFDLGEEIDFRIGFDPLDQILRHALAQIRAPDRDRDAAVVLAQVDRGLSGGVPPSDDHDRVSGADPRL